MNTSPPMRSCEAANHILRQLWYTRIYQFVVRKIPEFSHASWEKDTQTALFQKGRNLGWITHIHPVSFSRIIFIQTSQNGAICPEFPQVYSQHNSHFYYSHYAFPSMTRFGFVAFDGLNRIKSPIFDGEISQFEKHSRKWQVERTTLINHPLSIKIWIKLI